MIVGYNASVGIDCRILVFMALLEVSQALHIVLMAFPFLLVTHVSKN
jgi:hypothetical protein